MFVRVTALTTILKNHGFPMRNSTEASKNTQEYAIVSTPIGKFVEGCAQFMYKGKLISFSTHGYLSNACLNEVVVFDGEQFNNTFSQHSTVEEAINYINSQEG